MGRPMKLLRSFLAAGFILPVFCDGADQQRGETVELPEIVHEFYWVEFTLSQAAPESADGRYKLKRVHRNGDVEVFYSATLGDQKLIVVKPMPKRFKDGTEPPSVVVKTFDPAAQVVTIRELWMK